MTWHPNRTSNYFRTIGDAPNCLNLFAEMKHMTEESKKPLKRRINDLVYDYNYVSELASEQDKQLF